MEHLVDKDGSNYSTEFFQLQANCGLSKKNVYGSVSGKHALRQQARRRRRNTSIAAGNSPPVTRVTMKTNTSPAGLSPSGGSQASAAVYCSSSGKVVQSKSSTELAFHGNFESTATTELKTSDESNCLDGLTKIIINKFSPTICRKIDLDREFVNDNEQRNYVTENGKLEVHSVNTFSKDLINCSSVRTSSRLTNLNCISVVPFSSSSVSTSTSNHLTGTVTKKLRRY